MPTAVALLNYMTIKSFTTWSLFFPQTRIFRGVFGGRISETAMGGTGGIQCPILRFKEPKSNGVRSERARTLGKIPLV